MHIPRYGTGFPTSSQPCPPTPPRRCRTMRPSSGPLLSRNFWGLWATITSSHSSSVGSTRSLVLSPRLSITKLPDAIGSSPLSDDHADEVADLWVNKRRRMSTDSTSEPPSSTSLAILHTRNRTRLVETLPLVPPPWISPTIPTPLSTTWGERRAPSGALPCSSSLGSLVFIRILGIPTIHPDPSSGSSPLIRILTAHPNPQDPRHSSGSLGSLLLIRILAGILVSHQDTYHPPGSLLPGSSSRSSPLTRILVWIPPYHPLGSSRSTWTLILTGILVGSQTFWTPLRSPALR